MRITSDALKALFRHNIKSGKVKGKKTKRMKRTKEKTAAFLVTIKMCLTQLTKT